MLDFLIFPTNTKSSKYYPCQCTADDSHKSPLKPQDDDMTDIYGHSVSAMMHLSYGRSDKSMVHTYGRNKLIGEEVYERMYL